MTKIDESGTEPQAVMLSLDRAFDEPLKEDELALMKPFYKDFMYRERDVYPKKANVNVPPNYIYIGNITPLSNKDTVTYVVWESGTEIYRQFEYLSSNPFMAEPVLEKHGKSKLDFSGTSLNRLAADMTGVDKGRFIE